LSQQLRDDEKSGLGEHSTSDFFPTILFYTFTLSK
jgi:hypothetical protein